MSVEHLIFYCMNRSEMSVYIVNKVDEKERVLIDGGKFDYFGVGIDLRVWMRCLSDTCWERASVLCGESDKDVWLGSMVVVVVLLLQLLSVVPLYIITGSFFPQLLSCNQRPWFCHFCFIHLIHNSHLIILSFFFFFLFFIN